MTKILYTSNEVHQTIKQVLGNPSSDEERIVIVAYVGTDARAYLPSPENLTLICSLQPGSTSAGALNSLRKCGVTIKKSERLHMKVYWSSKKGCVITSANISTNALGRHGTKEAGVFLHPGVVDIRRLIHAARPLDVKPSDLRRLKRQSDILRAKIGPTGGVREAPNEFLSWYDNRDAEPKWKLGWYNVDSLEFAKTAIQASRTKYGIRPHNFLNHSKGQILEGDWLLNFELPLGRGVDWMYADLAAIKVEPMDRGAYEREYPFQALQVQKPRYYPSPPFKITSAFRIAFRKVVREVGEKFITQPRSLVPTEKMLRMIAEELRGA